jgi:outer membrane murein-binding lipoprotein Lpp
MKWIVAMVMVAGCVTREPLPEGRWPSHRKRHDTQLEDLLTRVSELEHEVAELRAAAAAAKKAPEPAPEPAPTPPTP